MDAGRYQRRRFQEPKNVARNVANGRDPAI